MKIALIGSGAAGAGVILGLDRAGLKAEIDLFDNAAEAAPSSPVEPRKDGLTRPQIAEIYRAVVREHGRSVPLPKSQFGYVAERLEVSGRPRIWRSRHRGGLTNFWGGTMLPLDERDLEDWPISRLELEPYYRAVIEAVGVSGAPDSLSQTLGGDFANRPRLQIHPMVERFIAALAPTTDSEDEQLVRAGVNRIALETRSNADNACVYCGECLIGCFRGAPFTTARWFNRWTASGRIARISDAKVTRINIKTRRLTVVASGQRTETHGPYDKIFIAAGCFGTTTLLMDSLGLDRAVMSDSAVYNTPIAYTGLHADAGSRKTGFGLTQALALIRHASDGAVAAQAQIYPTLPHFWRSASPSWLWGAAGLAGGILQARLLWARTYLAGQYSTQYRIERAGAGWRIELDGATGAKAAAIAAMGRLGDALSGSGFVVLPALSSAGGSSSHYGASQPFTIKGDIVDDAWRVADGVYVADSTAWPSVPAMSPTLTIMANAMRIAEHSI